MQGGPALPRPRRRPLPVHVHVHRMPASRPLRPGSRHPSVTADARRRGGRTFPGWAKASTTTPSPGLLLPHWLGRGQRAAGRGRGVGALVGRGPVSAQVAGRRVLSGGEAGGAAAAVARRTTALWAVPSGGAVPKPPAGRTGIKPAHQATLVSCPSSLNSALEGPTSRVEGWTPGTDQCRRPASLRVAAH